MDHVKVLLEKIVINEETKEATVMESEDLLKLIKDKQDSTISSDIGELNLRDINIDTSGRITFTNIPVTTLSKLEALKQNPDIMAMNIGECKNAICF